jgi:hypothetical protein
MFSLEGINTPIMCRNTEECHLTNSFHLIFEFSCPMSTEHENVGQNPPRSKKTRSQSTRSQNRVKPVFSGHPFKRFPEEITAKQYSGKMLIEVLGITPFLQGRWK